MWHLKNPKWCLKVPLLFTVYDLILFISTTLGPNESSGLLLEVLLDSSHMKLSTTIYWRYKTLILFHKSDFYWDMCSRLSVRMNPGNVPCNVLYRVSERKEQFVMKWLSLLIHFKNSLSLVKHMYMQLELNYIFVGFSI